jgi:hypothetical protein
MAAESFLSVGAEKENKNRRAFHLKSFPEITSSPASSRACVGIHMGGKRSEKLSGLI